MHPFFQYTVTHTETHPSSETPPEAITVHRLEDELTVLSVTGEDALSFLQGQITNDLAARGTDAACLAGYCTAQGRLLATAIFSQDRSRASTQTAQPAQSHEISMLLRSDIATAVAKRLSMFVLRSKVKIAPSAYAAAGVCAPNSKLDMLTAALGHDLPLTPWQTMHDKTGTWIAAPTRPGFHRWWWLASKEASEPIQINWPNLSAVLALADTKTWFTTDIQLGLPWVEAKTQDLFIPQTLNLDLIEGVSFTKGCYPGQEIVARSHYRGTLKRRMTLARVATLLGAEVTPGQDIYEGDQPCGRVINLSSSGEQSWLLLEAPFDAMDRNALLLGSATGPRVLLESLPYEIRPTKI